MTDAQWIEWTTYHGSLHRMQAAEDAAMILLWREVFEDRGFTMEELKVASRSLAENDPKRFRTEHLEYLLSSVGTARFNKARASLTTDDINEKSCGVCIGSGHAIVPHLLSVIDGEWHYPYYTMAVACHCDAGRRLLSRWEGYIQAAKNKDGKKGCREKIPPPFMPIENYAVKNQDWQDQVKTREAQRKQVESVKDRTKEYESKRPKLKLKTVDDDIRKLMDRAKAAP